MVITGLTNGTQYSVILRATNTSGDSANSNMVQSTPYTLPAAPTLGTITPGNQQLSVAFTAGANNGNAITNYEYSIDNGSTWTVRSPVSTTTPIVITGLTNGTTYSVKLRAVNAAGSGATQASGTSSTPRTVPDQVGTVTPTPGNALVSLAWYAPATGGSPITGYRVDRSTDNLNWTQVIASTPSSPYSVTGLINGTLY
ncbi:hypothetical protein EB118_17135 [bacterium]|nr:hypothetical protein [Actinomycetota bacterium]NDG31781.1 hypothetical protein [bacterium]